MKQMSRSVLVVVVITLAAGVALAVASPLQISAGLGSGVLSIATNQMPKGWFFSSGGLDRTDKSYLTTTYALGATACSDAKAGGSLSSKTIGDFTEELNNAGQIVGWYWDTMVDLSASANRFYFHEHCDGTIEVHGCDESIPVTVTTTAYTKSGACHTYEDGGVTRCIADTDLAYLDAVEEPTVVDVCSLDCGIGACVSEREHQCNLITDKAQRQACHRATPCICKLALPEGCPAHEECLD